MQKAVSTAYKWLPLMAVLVVVPAIALSEILEIETPSQEPPCVVGHDINCYVVNNAWETNWYKLATRCLEGGAGSWSADQESGNPYFSVSASRVGSIDARFRDEEVHETGDMEYTTTTHEKTESYTIVPPNKDEIIQGLNTNSVGDIVEVHFAVKYVDEPSNIDQLIGPSTDGDAEEKIWLWDPVLAMWNGSNWLPDGEFLYLQDGIIIDSKAFDTSSTAFQNAANGQHLRHIRQANRLVIKDCTGTNKNFPLGLRQFEFNKVNANTWVMQETAVGNPN